MWIILLLLRVARYCTPLPVYFDMFLCILVYFGIFRALLRNVTPSIRSDTGVFYDFRIMAFPKCLSF